LRKKKIDLKGDVLKAYETMDHWKRILITYHKPLPATEVYKKWKEENPPKYPGPQQYYKTPLQTFEKKKKKAGEDDEVAAVDEDAKKENYADRKKIDKRIYKPMKGHIF